MGAGRKAIPDHIKVLKGTDQPCRMRNQSKKHSKAEILAPDWMDSGASEYFEHIGSELSGVNLNSQTYSYIAALAASRMAEIKECDELIAAEGRLIASANTVRANPVVAQRSDAMRHLQSLCSELGLTPTSIAKAGIKTGNEKKTGFKGL